MSHFIGLSHLGISSKLSRQLVLKARTINILISVTISGKKQYEYTHRFVKGNEENLPRVIPKLGPVVCGGELES
jgi:hypothetical protein